MELDVASVQEIVEALLAEIKSVDRLIPDREEYPMPSGDLKRSYN
jgi:hypothetical protein